MNKCEKCGGLLFHIPGRGGYCANCIECEGKTGVPLTEVFEALERQQKLLFSLTDVVVGYIRREYIKNLCQLELYQSEQLEKANKELLYRMVQMLVEMTLVENPGSRKMTRDELSDGFKKSLLNSIDEYLKGMPDEQV